MADHRASLFGCGRDKPILASEARLSIPRSPLRLRELEVPFVAATFFEGEACLAPFSIWSNIDETGRGGRRSSGRGVRGQARRPASPLHSDAAVGATCGRSGRRAVAGRGRGGPAGGENEVVVVREGLLIEGDEDEEDQRQRGG